MTGAVVSISFSDVGAPIAIEAPTDYEERPAGDLRFPIGE